MATIDRSIQYTQSKGTGSQHEPAGSSARMPLPLPVVAVMYEQIIISAAGDEIVGSVHWHKLGFYIKAAARTGIYGLAGAGGIRGYFKNWEALETFTKGRGWQIYSA